MITFEGKNTILNYPDRITRRVNSVYPALSEYKTSLYIDNLNEQGCCNRKFLDFRLINSNKIQKLRLREEHGMPLFRNIINTLKEHKLGNCYDKSRLAEIIGKINGQENINTANVYITRNQSNYSMKLGHVVSVITKEKIEPNIQYPFKNKECIILDPFFGITEFAGNYFKRLKNEFHKYFTYIQDDFITNKLISKKAVNLKEYKNLKKQCGFSPKFYIKLHDEEPLSAENALKLREEYPELIIKNYKNIIL